jgi:hypothetical protein
MPKAKSINRHHIDYEAKGPKGGTKQFEWVVPLYYSEHRIITMLQRYKKVSKGFIYALKHELIRLEYSMEDLDVQG